MVSRNRDDSEDSDCRIPYPSAPSPISSSPSPELRPTLLKPLPSHPVSEKSSISSITITQREVSPKPPTQTLSPPQLAAATISQESLTVLDALATLFTKPETPPPSNKRKTIPANFKPPAITSLTKHEPTVTPPPPVTPPPLIPNTSVRRKQPIPPEPLSQRKHLQLKEESRPPVPPKPTILEPTPPTSPPSVTRTTQFIEPIHEPVPMGNTISRRSRRRRSSVQSTSDSSTRRSTAYPPTDSNATRDSTDISAPEIQSDPIVRETTHSSSITGSQSSASHNSHTVVTSVSAYDDRIQAELRTVASSDSFIEVQSQLEIPHIYLDPRLNVLNQFVQEYSCLRDITKKKGLPSLLRRQSHYQRVYLTLKETAPQLNPPFAVNSSYPNRPALLLHLFHTSLSRQSKRISKPNLDLPHFQRGHHLTEDRFRQIVISTHKLFDTLLADLGSATVSIPLDT